MPISRHLVLAYPCRLFNLQDIFGGEFTQLSRIFMFATVNGVNKFMSFFNFIFMRFDMKMVKKGEEFRVPICSLQKYEIKLHEISRIFRNNKNRKRFSQIFYALKDEKIVLILKNYSPSDACRPIRKFCHSG